MNQTMRRKQLSNLVNPVSHPGNRPGACPLLEAPFLQRRGVFTGTLDLDLDSPPADAGGYVRLAAFVHIAMSFLGVAAGETVDVIDNSSHYGIFSWCLHDRSISCVDILATVC